MTATVLAFPAPKLSKADARTLSVVEVSKIVRRELKAAFPAVKFSVRSNHGTSVDVSYMDGPSVSKVRAIVGKWQGKHFNGSDDSTSYAPAFLFEGELVSTYCWTGVTRRMSPAFVSRVIAALVKYWGLNAPTASPASGYDGSSHVVATHEQDREAMTRTGRYWNELVYQAAEDRRVAEPHTEAR